jgi:hypothetical protein
MVMIGVEVDHFFLLDGEPPAGHLEMVDYVSLLNKTNLSSMDDLYRVYALFDSDRGFFLRRMFQDLFFMPDPVVFSLYVQTKQHPL